MTLSRLPRRTLAVATLSFGFLGLVAPVHAAASTPGQCTLATGTSNTASCEYVAGGAAGEVLVQAFATASAYVSVTVDDLVTGQTVVSGCGPSGSGSLSDLCDYAQTVGDTYQVTVQTGLASSGLVSETDAYAAELGVSTGGASDSVTAVAVAQDTGSLLDLLNTVNGLLSGLS